MLSLCFPLFSGNGLGFANLGLDLPISAWAYRSRNGLSGVVVDDVVAWWLETGLGFLLILETGLNLRVGNGLSGMVAWWLETGQACRSQPGFADLYLGLPISAWWSVC